MRLTAFSDYTLRTLIYLALRPDTLCTIEEIAAAYDISANHLTKVVHQAAQAGEIATLRGQRGGMRLARRADTINIGTVLRRTEPDLDIAPCFGPAAVPSSLPVCCKVCSAMRWRRFLRCWIGRRSRTWSDRSAGWLICWGWNRRHDDAGLGAGSVGGGRGDEMR